MKIDKIPKVSVIIPCYNHEEYIATAIESVLNQTYTDYELIVADNGCTDRSSEIIESYAGRIQILKLEKNDPPQCIRRLLGMARGEYIAELCSDDYWHPEKLEKQMKAVENHKHCGIFFSWAEMVDETLENVKDNQQFAGKNRSRGGWLGLIAKRGTPFELSSLLIKNDGRYQKYYYNVEKFKQLPDLAFYINMLMGEEVYVVEEYLVKHRMHGKNASKPTHESAGHTYSEYAYVMRMLWENMSDEMFLDAFQDELPSDMDRTNDSDIMCNRILTFIEDAKVTGWDGQAAIEYCWEHYYDGSVADILEHKYGFSLNTLYQYAMKLGIGTYYWTLKRQESEKCIEQKEELIKSISNAFEKIVRVFQHSKARSELKEPIILVIETYMKALPDQIEDKLLDCYKYVLCMDDGAPEEEWAELMGMLQEVMEPVRKGVTL